MAEDRMNEPRIEDYTLDNGQFDQTEYHRDVDQYMASLDRAAGADDTDDEV